MIDPNLENHHQQTAYLAYMIGGAAGFDEYELGLTSFASLVHAAAEHFSDRQALRFHRNCRKAVFHILTSEGQAERR